METKTGYFLSQEEMDMIHGYLRDAKSAIRFCKEDKGVGCITCDKRQVRYALSQIVEIIGEDRFDGEGKLLTKLNGK